MNDRVERGDGEASGRAVIRNNAGIHCRPTAVIVKEARQFDDDITVGVDEGETADPKSAIELLSLGLDKGAEVTIRAVGGTAAACVEAMIELLEREYDFPPRDESSGGDPCSELMR